MKVRIGKHPSWFGPYQLAEKLCFWAKPVTNEYGFKDPPDWVHNFGTWLAHGKTLPTPKKLGEDHPRTLLYKFLAWVYRKRQQKVYVRIDRWDTWGMDHTLAHIVLPMLVQLKATKQGAPYVDNEDVPEELRSTNATNEGEVDNLHFKRWDWVLDEMIFAFHNKLDDNWEAKFETGTFDWSLEPNIGENGKPKYYEMVHGPNHTYKVDQEARNAYQKRISNGFLLFGKYYECLWN